MPLQFLDVDPEPQPAEANAKTFHRIQDLLGSKTEVELDPSLPFIVVRATCEVSEGMIRPGDGLMEYLSHCDELKPLTLEAFKLRSFEKLRKTVVLRESRPNFMALGEDLAELEKHATRVSWNTEYQGKAASHLELAVRNMSRSRMSTPVYANMMTIIQSSGTGKSRMVDQLALKVFTFPFNLQDPAETEQGAYPDPDSRVFNEFINNSMDGTKVKVAARFGAFLVALFDRVVQALTLHDQSVPLPQWWYQYLLRKGPEKRYGNNRERLYAEAIENRKAIFAEIQSKVTERIAAQPHYPSAIWKEVAKTCLTNSAGTLGKKISELSPDRLIIIYFDESHTLLKNTLQDGTSRYHALCLALDCLSESPIFSLFLSTNSSVSRCAPSFSARINKANGLQAPFTELPFDCHPAFPLSQDQYTLQESGSGHGTILPWIHKPKKSVIGLAKRKLAPALVTHQIRDLHPTLAELAVLDIRLLLNFQPTICGKEAGENMVASKMRIAHSVPQHGYYMHSSYPSEPILAEAAASIWSKCREDDGELAIPKMLERQLATPLINKGERRELVARLILTLAYDAAVRRHERTLHTHAVSLQSFLEELFGDANYECIANSKPDVDGDTFRDAFKNAYIRFTHFVRAGDESAVSTEAAYAAILRSMAFQCSRGHKTIDIMIPVALKDETLKEEIITGILISVKDDVKASTRTSIDIDASKLSFFPEDQKLFGGKHLRPHISLIMELGIVPTKKHDATGSEDVEPPTKKSKVEPVSLDVGNPEHALLPHVSPKLENPRYRIYAYGCSRSVYKVVTSKEVFAKLLASFTWLAEHPRQDDAFLGAVKEQKPFWSRGIEFYGWLKDVKTLRDSSFSEEGVEVDEERRAMEESKASVPSSSKQKETIEPESDVRMGSYDDAVEDQEPEELSKAGPSVHPPPKPRQSGRTPSKKGKEPEVESKHSKEKSKKRSAPK